MTSRTEQSILKQLDDCTSLLLAKKFQKASSLLDSAAAKLISITTNTVPTSPIDWGLLLPTSSKKDLYLFRLSLGLLSNKLVCSCSLVSDEQEIEKLLSLYLKWRHALVKLNPVSATKYVPLEATVFSSIWKFSQILIQGSKKKDTQSIKKVLSWRKKALAFLLGSSDFESHFDRYCVHLYRASVYAKENSVQYQFICDLYDDFGYNDYYHELAVKCMNPAYFDCLLQLAMVLLRIERYADSERTLKRAEEWINLASNYDQFSNASKFQKLSLYLIRGIVLIEKHPDLALKLLEIVIELQKTVDWTLVEDLTSRDKLCDYEEAFKLNLICKDWVDSYSKLRKSGSSQGVQYMKLFILLSEVFIFYSSLVNYGIQLEKNASQPRFQPYRQLQWVAWSAAVFIYINDELDDKKALEVIESGMKSVRDTRSWVGMKCMFNSLQNAASALKKRGESMQKGLEKLVWYRKASFWLSMSCDLQEEYMKRVSGEELNQASDEELKQLVTKLQILCNLQLLCNNEQEAVSQARQAISVALSKTWEARDLFPLIDKYVYCCLKSKCCESLYSSVYSAMPNMTLESMTPLIEHELSIYTRYQRHDLRRSCLDVVLNGRYREDGLYYCWALTNRALVIRDVGEQSDEASPLLEEAVSLEAEYAKRGKKPCWMRKFRVEVLIAKGWLMIQRVEGAVNPSSVQESLGGLAACFESWGRLMGGDGDVLRLRSLNQHARLLALLHDVGPLLHFYGNFELYIVCLKLMLKLYSVEKGDEASRANTLLCYTRMGEIYHYLGYSSSLVSDCFIRSCSERGVEGGCLEDTERVIKALDYFQQIGRVDKRSGLSRLKQIVCSLEQGIYVNSAQVTKEMYQVLALGRYALASLKVVFGEVDEAIIESKMALQLRQLILPQKDSSLKRLTEMASKIASSRGMPCRWRFVHCFADSLEQLGVLYKLQGAFRMSEYYLKKGLELAHSLNSEYLQNRILLHLSRLYHRADKVDAWKEVLKELDAFQYMQADRGPRNLAKVPEIAINGLIHVGNWYLKVEESIDHVLWSYREAEWYLSLTKDEYDMKTLEERTSVMSIVAEEREIGVLGQRLGVRLEGETRAELEGADITLNDYMLLRRMESRILLKKGIAMFYAARRVSESEKRERLVEARELLSGVVDRLDCLGRFVPLEAEKALAMLNLAEIDLILLDGLESAVADEGACCASSDGVRGCWNRGFEGSEIEGRRMEEIRDRLKGALDLCVSSGSMPLLTSSICKVLASTIGVLDAWRTAALLNYAVGMTIRHQALCDIYDKALSVKKKGGEVWKRFSDSSEHCDEGEPPSCREAAGGSRDSLRLAEDLDAEVSDAKKWPKVLSSALPKSEKWAGWYRWNRAELSGRPFHESVSKLLNFHKLCKHWTVATLCLDLDGDHLMVTRIQRGQSPIVARRSLVQVISGFETVESLKVLSKQFTESVLVSNASASSFRISKKKVQCLPAQMPSDRARHSRSSYGTASFGQLVSQFDQIIRELDKPAVKEKADSEFLVAWWRHRIQLNTRLGLLINQMEDCLLGPWKVLLLGDYESSAVNRRLDSSVSSLERHLNKILRPYCPDFIISRSLLRAILFGVDVLAPAQLEEALAYLFGMEAVTRGDGCSYKWRLVRGAAQESDILKLASSLLVSTYNGVLGDFRQLGIRLSSSFKYVVSQKAVMMQKIEQVPRHPTILILDKQLHRLPWESFPSLCCAPISRMPSLAFMRAWILAHLHPRSPSNILRDGLQTDKTFYVLNPGGDLKRTQELLSPIFEQECEWKGIVNQIPEKEEIEDALSRHQLFIYCGHNAGEHYLSRSDIQKIESGVGGCVALLMGCASLKIDDHAEFEPSSLAFSYIISGTQCLVGNLWSVTAGDLDLETQRILQWIRGNREDEDDDSRSLAHIISLARSIKEIKFKYLNAAALVCYGLPVYKREKFQATCISKK